MKIYKSGIDADKLQLANVEIEMDIVFRSSVATSDDLPTSDNISADARLCLDTDHLFVYVDGEWLDQGVLDMGDLMQERLMQGLS